MATAPEMDIPVPRYQIGDVVWWPLTEQTVEKLPCPDFLGSKVWAVKSPAGECFTTACPRCERTYSLTNDLPSLDIKRYVAKAIARVITGYEVKSHADSWGDRVRYTAQNYSMDESKVYASEAAALEVATIQAAELNAKADESPQTLTSRHFSSLSLETARTDQMKNGLWSAHYHAGNLLQRVKEALYGEDGEETDETPDHATVIESLRDAVRWDFKYHIENMPLRDLFIAASASEDEAVAAAVATLPKPMIELFVEAPAEADAFA